MKILTPILAGLALTTAFAFSAPTYAADYNYPETIQMQMVAKMTPESKKAAMDMIKQMEDMKMAHEMEKTQSELKFQEAMMKMKKKFDDFPFTYIN